MSNPNYICACWVKQGFKKKKKDPQKEKPRSVGESVCLWCTVNPDQLIVLKPFSSSDCLKRFKLLTVEKINLFKYSQLKFAIVIT